MAPQSEWPQMTMSRTPSTTTAYSIEAETPPVNCAVGGTMFPALRQTKISPGPDCMISSGITRLSAQEMTRAFGCCPFCARWR